MKHAERQIETWLLGQAHRLFIVSPDFDDIEIVHQMRVASRRLRVGLEFFAACFEPRELKQVLQQLRRLGKALGAVRVLDVNLTMLSTANGCAALKRKLTVERKARLAELCILYRATMTAKIGSRVETLVMQRRGKTDGRLALGELRRQLRRCLKRFDARRGTEAFHRLRIAVKKYRYGLEIVGATKRIQALKQLQELMGRCHDVEVLLERLPDGPLKKHFRKEHRRQYDAVQKFLDGSRRWVKKVNQNHE